MAEGLFVEAGEDGNLWITSCRFGTAVVICKEAGGKWFAAEDDSYRGQIRFFTSLEVLPDHI